MMLDATRKLVLLTATMGASTESTRMVAVLVGPVERKREEPQRAPTTEAMTAE